jgi:DNA-binding NtrC family response regulator
VVRPEGAGYGGETGATLPPLRYVSPLVRVFLMGGNVAEKPITNPTILAVFPADEDRASLIDIFAHSDWKIGFTGVQAETRRALLRSAVGAVVSDSRLADGYCWQDLLREMQAMDGPPPLIVADRLADDRLWAEVLNLGAYDLLAKPFDSREVLHAVTSACRHAESERRIVHHRKPAKSSRQDSATVARTRIAGAG